MGGGDDIQEGPVPTILTPESGQGAKIEAFTPSKFPLSLVFQQLEVSNSVKYKVMWELQIFVCNVKFTRFELCAFLDISATRSFFPPYNSSLI